MLGATNGLGVSVTHAEWPGLIWGSDNFMNVIDLGTFGTECRDIFIKIRAIPQAKEARSLPTPKRVQEL